MIEHHMPQGTPEWFEVRRGIPTASNFDRIITPSKGKPSAQQDDYICELIADLSALTPPWFSETGRIPNPAMQAGIDCEPEARKWLEMELGQNIREVGFCLADNEHCGCSPDGLLGEDAGVEIKCPLLKTQAKYLLEGTLPTEYKTQIHGSLWVTGRQYWMFLSYAPGLTPFLLRVERDDFTELLGREVEAFWEKYQAAYKRLHPEQAAVREAMQEWLQFLKGCPTAFDLNMRLPGLAVLPADAKRSVWRACKAYAAELQMVFNYDEKLFVPREAPEPEPAF